MKIATMWVNQKAVRAVSRRDFVFKSDLVWFVKCMHNPFGIRPYNAPVAWSIRYLIEKEITNV